MEESAFIIWQLLLLLNKKMVRFALEAVSLFGGVQLEALSVRLKWFTARHDTERRIVAKSAFVPSGRFLLSDAVAML